MLLAVAVVKTFPYLPLLALGFLVCLLPPRVQAEDTAEAINAMLKAGKEVGWIVGGGGGKEEDLAVLFTSRAKGSKPTDFPYLVTGEVRPADTDVLGGEDGTKPAVADERTEENIVVSLKEKRVLGTLKAAPTVDDDSEVYFPGKNHRSLDALWGPDVQGRRFGVVDFGGRWDSLDVLLIETDGKSLRQTSLKTLLDAKAKAFITTALKGSKDANADDYAVSYDLQGVVDPGKPYAAGSPVTVKIGFSGEIPKGDSGFDGTMTVLLESSQGKISAKVLKVEAAKP